MTIHVKDEQYTCDCGWTGDVESLDAFCCPTCGSDEFKDVKPEAAVDTSCMRRSDTDIATVVMAKLLLERKVLGIDIARITGLTPVAISGIKHGRRWRDVKLPYIAMSLPDVKPYKKDADKATLLTWKITAISVGNCIGCGKLLLDDGVEPVIYLVSDDELACGQVCVNRARRLQDAPKSDPAKR